MIAPTERSMPAVRTTSVCAAPRMPTMATCCRISVSVKGEKNFEPRKSAEEHQREHQHDQRHQRGLECSACCIRSISGLLVALEGGDLGGAVLQDRLEFLGWLGLRIGHR